MLDRRAKGIAASIVIILGVVARPSLADDALSVMVDEWNPPFNQSSSRTTQEYRGLVKATRHWRLCVSIPHLRDPYWAAVNYGLIDQAKSLGVGLRLLEAGGYGNLETQRKQIQDCMDSGADGLIVSAVHATGLNDLVKSTVASGRPVIDMINTMDPRYISARSAVDYYDMGHATGLFLRARHADTPSRVKVAWFPGPAGPAWVDRGDAGFRAAIKGSNIEIVATSRGDTTKAAQAKLVKDTLEKQTDLDYIIGTTVTATAAVGLLRDRELSEKIKLISYYYGPAVHRAIRRRTILAAPTDSQSLQARIAVDLAIKLLEKRDPPLHIAPKVKIIDQKSVRSFDTSGSLPPRGFRPVFSINNW